MKSAVVFRILATGIDVIKLSFELYGYNKMDIFLEPNYDHLTNIN